jgi:Holliday junction DNA helicase RuvA
MEALESLGFQRQSSSEALASIAKKRGSVEGLGVEDLIMLALRELNSRA